MTIMLVITDQIMKQFLHDECSILPVWDRRSILVLSMSPSEERPAAVARHASVVHALVLGDGGAAHSAHLLALLLLLLPLRAGCAAAAGTRHWRRGTPVGYVTATAVLWLLRLDDPPAAVAGLPLVLQLLQMVQEGG